MAREFFPLHPNTQGRARRERGGEQGLPEVSESLPEEAERRRIIPRGDIDGVGEVK